MNEMGGSVEDLIKSQLDTEAGKAPFSCIIGSSFPAWTFLVAKKFELPFVAFWPQSLSVYTIYRHLSIIISKGHYPPKNEGALFLLPFELKVDLGVLKCNEQRLSFYRSQGHD
jgi:hypothetical protein